MLDRVAALFDTAHPPDHDAWQTCSCARCIRRRQERSELLAGIRPRSEPVAWQTLDADGNPRGTHYTQWEAEHQMHRHQMFGLTATVRIRPLYAEEGAQAFAEMPPKLPEGICKSWGPPRDEPRTPEERRAVAAHTHEVLRCHEGAALVESGIERHAGKLDGDGMPMSDIPVAYVAFPGGAYAARCTHGDVASFHTKEDREAWSRWQAGRPRGNPCVT